MIPIKRVKRVSFSILSSKDIQEMAVMQVRSGEATENKIDTLYDLRMGTTSDDNHCQSCGLDVRSCPGHPGYVYLTRPVYNVLFLHQIAGILKSTYLDAVESWFRSRNFRNYWPWFQNYA